MTAITALTAQNTLGVEDIHHVPAEFVRKQIDAVFKDIKPDVVKTGVHRRRLGRLKTSRLTLFCTGMLATTAIIETVSKAFTDYNVNRLVLDPVRLWNFCLNRPRGSEPLTSSRSW